MSSFTPEHWWASHQCHLPSQSFGPPCGGELHCVRVGLFEVLFIYQLSDQEVRGRSPPDNAIRLAHRAALAADLPDERLESRLTAILVNTVEHPSASIPQAMDGDAGQAKATYRFYANPRVTAPGVAARFAVETAQRSLDQDILLVVQDTTTLNFTGLHCIPELGPIDSGGWPGRAFAHRLGRDQLGTSHRHLGPAVLVRPQRGQPGPEEKESDKWINGIDASCAVLYQAAGEQSVPRLIHVMDREGDAYEVMMTVADAGQYGDHPLCPEPQKSTTRWPSAARGCGASRSCAGRG